jgi:hypothetical protein
VLILVVAVLVLMVLIGTAYIQAARNDRAATATMNNSNIGLAIDAEIARVASLLKADVVSDTGNVLDDGESREPYDYPHKNVDPWLSFTHPESIGGTYQWRHVSNVTNDAASWSLRGNDNDDELSFGGFDFEGTDKTIGASDDRADANGDGLPDSRWVDSAIGSVRGTRYVAAVQVKDLSSLLNVNVALAQASAVGTNYFDPTNSVTYDGSNEAPRFWYPSELDLGEFLMELGSYVSTTDRDGEIKALLGYRLDQSSATLPTSWADRYTFWQNAGRMYGNFNDGAGTSYRPLGLAEEMKLRRYNGLNSPDMAGTVLDEEFPKIMREQDSGGSVADAEALYRDVPGVTYPLHFCPQEPRHQMTTVSGAAVVAPLLSGESGRKLQVDINHAIDATNPNVTVDDLATTIRDIYAEGTPTLPSNVPTVSEFANQLAASIADYADADSKLTRVGDQYGMEQLPFITEVYLQYDYQASGAVAGSGPNLWNVTLTKGGDSAFAIEIRNPFRTDIAIDSTNAPIRVKIGAMIQDLSANGNLLASDEYLLVVSGTGSGSPKQFIAAAHGLTGDGKLNKQVVWNAMSFDSLSGDTLIELQAQDSSGAWVTYQQVTLNEIPNPNTYNATDFSYSSNPNDQWFYKQRSTKGNGKGLNMLTVQDIGSGATNRFKSSISYQETGADAQWPVAWAEIDNLGDESKTAGSEGGSPDVLGTGGFPDLVDQQLLIINDSESKLRYLGHVMNVAAIGPTTTTTIPEAWGTAENVLQFMVNPKATAYVDSNNNFEVPHAVLLLDRLTTLSPQFDGQDNDGDGSATNEAFVPGRLNLNTASAELLKRTLPFAPFVRDRVIDKIIDYRNGSRAATVAAPTNVRTDADGPIPGIAYIGELAIVRQVWEDLAPTTASTDLTTTTLGDDTYTLNSAIVDFNSTSGDGVPDDREEQTMILSWLSQMCTVRSDVFAAYVTVRGYPGGDFDEDPIEEIRFVAILDRSGITSADDKVKVLAVMRY